MSKYLLSVIIPVYNAEKYIENNVQFLLNQSLFSQLQLIFVDDGSTDKSFELLQKNLANYKNVKLFSKQNGGVSTARNLGLDFATGDFFAFFDIDDMLEKDYYERLLEKQKIYNSDITIGNYVKILTDGNKKKYRKLKRQYWNNSSSAMNAFLSGRGMIGNNVFDKLFKSNIFKEIRFQEGYRIGEDMYFVYECLKRTHSVFLDSSVCGYYYKMNSSSAMNMQFSDRFFDAVKLSQKIKDNEPNNVYAASHYIHEECKLIENMLRTNGVRNFVSEYNIYVTDLKSYSLKWMYSALSFRQFMGIVLMRMSPNLYLFVHRILRIG